MREKSSLRAILFSPSARNAGGFAAFSLALWLSGGGSARAATSFQLAYMYGTSGPSAGGTPVNLVGNQFVSGATVTVGGVSAVATVTSSTRIGATTPGLAPGALYDVAVTNPGGPSSTLVKGWLSDFTDVPSSSPYHGPVETILRDGITSGCGGGNYCSTSSVTRAQMAVFLLRAEHGSAYVPPPATGAVFGDVHVGDFAADWIEQLYAEGVTGGCSASPPLFCPADSVTRGQMAAFLLKIYHGNGYTPPAATGIFSDVPVSMPLAPWIEEIARLYVTVGCGGTSYCPSSAVTRGQMAVFLAKTFHRPEGIRFLQQATWGPKDQDVSTLLGQGYLPWLAAQYQLPPSSYPTMTLWPNTTPASCDSNCRLINYGMYPLQTRFFTNAMYNPDQLRQRVAFALHKLVVVSGNSITHPSQVVPYLQILDQNALGDYQDILYDETLIPAMGDYLNMDTSTLTNPNENYPREIIQLFSIGTELLNQDGSTQNDGGGNPLPSYDQSVIDNLKKVFTGWYVPNNAACDPASGAGNTCSDYLNPMPLHRNGQGNVDRHDTTEKDLFVGFLPNANGEGAPTIIPAGQTPDQDLNQAIDAIFNHPNLGPYLARELIHSLVTSNPSPGYIERVAGFFNDDGTGARGKLWAVVKAVLLDPEARGAPSDPNYGKLKEPVLYVNNVLRAFNAMSANRSTTSDGYINPQTASMAQDTFRPGTVFSYFPQDYLAPPASAGLLGPEFGIMDASTSLRRANFINTIVFANIPVSCGSTCTAPNGTSIDLSELQLLSSNPANLVDRLNRLMMHGTMSDEMKNSIITAVSAVASSNTLLRARQALYLVATASQYQVQR